MKKHLLTTLILASIGVPGCNKANDGTPGNGPGDCYPEDPGCETVICTAQFVGVIVQVKDAGGAPVVLDAFVVTDPAGTPLPPSSSGLPVFGSESANGAYAVINDAWLNGHRNSSASVRAKGFVNGVQVFDEPYAIAADCCHVRKVSGKAAITIP